MTQSYRRTGCLGEARPRAVLGCRGQQGLELEKAVRGDAEFDESVAEVSLLTVHEQTLP